MWKKSIFYSAQISLVRFYNTSTKWVPHKIAGPPNVTLWHAPAALRFTNPSILSLEIYRAYLIRCYVSTSPVICQTKSGYRRNAIFPNGSETLRTFQFVKFAYLMITSGSFMSKSSETVSMIFYWQGQWAFKHWKANGGGGERRRERDQRGVGKEHKVRLVHRYGVPYLNTEFFGSIYYLNFGRSFVTRKYNAVNKYLDGNL